MNYIVYNDLFADGKWFYGMYKQEDANETASRMNKTHNGANYCVCPLTDIYKLNICNLPAYAITTYLDISAE